MKNRLFFKTEPTPLSDSQRAILGFLFGAVIMSVLVRFAVVNDTDFYIMQRGTSEILHGINPWTQKFYGFYNSPFSVIFLWPLLFLTPQLLQVVGGALLFAVIFVQKTPVAIAWFFTNSLLWVVAMGGVDMYSIGAGLLLLFAGDKFFETKAGLLARVLAFGFLLIKPQGGIFIVALYILLRRDWKGVLISIVVYGLFFITLYPAWVRTILSHSPITAVSVDHSIWGKFGLIVAIIIACLVTVARRWRYWQLGGALAGILTPYGMPGIPIFLTLSAVRSLKAIPIVIIFSICLSVLTWLAKPPSSDMDFNAYVKPFLEVYNLSMLGLALALATVSEPDPEADVIVITEKLRQPFQHLWDTTKKVFVS